MSILYCFIKRWRPEDSDLRCMRRGLRWTGLSGGDVIFTPGSDKHGDTWPRVSMLGLSSIGLSDAGLSDAGLKEAGLSSPGLGRAWLGVDSVSIVMGW
jgi:hypothetical protein